MYITYVSCVINILFLYFALKYTYMQKKEGWEGRQTERVRGKEKERVQCHLHKTSFGNLQNHKLTHKHTDTQHITHNYTLNTLKHLNTLQNIHKHSQHT